MIFWASTALCCINTRFCISFCRRTTSKLPSKLTATGVMDDIKADDAFCFQKLKKNIDFRLYFTSYLITYKRIVHIDFPIHLYHKPSFDEYTKSRWRILWRNLVCRDEKLRCCHNLCHRLRCILNHSYNLFPRYAYDWMSRMYWCSCKHYFDGY